MDTYISKTGKGRAQAPIKSVMKLSCRRTSSKLAFLITAFWPDMSAFVL